MNEKFKSIKEKASIILGAILVGIVVIGLSKSLYNRYVSDPVITSVKKGANATPVKNALFWYEMELERIASNANKIRQEETDFVTPLYNDLKNNGIANEYMQTLSDRAVEVLTNQGDYYGQEPDVWAIAQEKGIPYIFKIVITDVEFTRRGSNVASASYLIHIYDTAHKKLIWEGKTTREAGVFDDMPSSEKYANALKKELQSAKIID